MQLTIVVVLVALFGVAGVRWIRQGVREFRTGHRLSGAWVSMIGTVACLLAVVVGLSSIDASGTGDSEAAPRRSAECRAAKRVAAEYVNDANSLRRSASATDALNPSSPNYDVARLLEWQETADLWANVVSNDPDCFSVRDRAKASDWLRKRSG